MVFRLEHSNRLGTASVLSFAVGLVLVLSAAGPVHAALTANSATTTTVTLTWQAPDDGASGVASEYDIRYSTSMITESNWASATQVTGEPTPLSAGTQQSFTVTGLTAGVTYYFAAKAADDASNWSALSSVVERCTPVEGTPPATITTLTTTGATISSITLSWTAPGDDGSTGTASRYDIRYSTSTLTSANFCSATQATGMTSPKVAGSTETFTITGLSSGVLYYIAIKTVDDASNWSCLSNVVSRITTATDTTPPTAINDLTAL